MPSVFVSYSHDPANPEHSHKVLGMAASLMRDGLTVFIDQNRSADEEKIPWPSWMEDKIESADHVLLVCTELYLNKVRQKVPNDVGHGVCWEANLIYNALYISKLNTRKFIPVVFTDSERQFIPTPLRGANSFVLDSPSAYKRLIAFLTGQHRLRFPKQGAQLPVIAEEEVEPMFPRPTPLPARVQVTSRRRRDRVLRPPKEPSSARKKPPISSRPRRPSGLESHFFWGLPLTASPIS